MSSVSVEISAVRKTFGPTVALADVSLRAYSGEVHAIIGENGAAVTVFIDSDHDGIRDAGEELTRLHKLTRADCTTRNRRRARRKSVSIALTRTAASAASPFRSMMPMARAPSETHICAKSAPRPAPPPTMTTDRPFISCPPLRRPAP